MKLYGYFRSSAAFRVRIALNLKGVTVEHAFCHLRRGEQSASDYLKLNPQGLVPTLVLDDGTVLTQSLAIIEWLEETRPEPALLPADPVRRAKVRALAGAIACDTHPLQNLRVLREIRSLGGGEAAQAWARRVNEQGLAACEMLVAAEPGPFCFGERPTMADICLVPQMANARRYGVELAGFPRLLQAEAAAMALPAFADAHPDRQADAE
ncbi:maleylacetoacetate isomerase [Enterovirga sp. CN4-39]|uniref:maleylacetoacetate isomerase n=1 Tax=Enterovirga sp. CN4-39 TaxID=3400910 RepID=UPI003BFCC889